MTNVPTKTAKGTVIDPVAMLCATVCFLGMLATFIILALYGDSDRISELLRPLIPTLAALGSACLLWVKNHQGQELNTQQNVVIAEKADEAALLAENANTVVTQRLDGELDARIKNAVLEALHPTMKELEESNG